jgi:hypothetical protein
MITNFATTEKQIRSNNATLEQCYRQGQTHKSYGWAKSPYGTWNEEQMQAYNKGYAGD